MSDRPIQWLFRDTRPICQRQKRAAPTNKPHHPLPFSLASLTLSYDSKSVASPVGDESMFFSKSYAQVATPVLPCGVIPESGELKFDDEDKKSAVEKRSSPMTFRASDVQKEIIRAKAKTVGVTVNQFILASLLGSRYRLPKVAGLIKALQALNLELTRQGTNLNQIAFLRNAGKATDAEADSMLGIIARSLLKTHQAIRDALARGQDMPEP